MYNRYPRGGEDRIVPLLAYPPKAALKNQMAIKPTGWLSGVSTSFCHEFHLVGRRDLFLNDATSGIFSGH